jgi:hypothetical protein
MARGTRRRRDGQPTAEEEAGPTGGEAAQIELNLTFRTADKFARNIKKLTQQMDDLKMQLASEYKAFEEAGGDRAALKSVMKLAKQDVSKTIAQLKHREQYEQWFLKPLLDDAAAAEAEAAGA